MENFYKGTEIKFSIGIVAEGFDPDTDDFDIEVASGKSGSVKGSKTGEPVDGKYGSEEVCIAKDNDTWQVIADSEKLPKGDLRVIMTCYTPDTMAADGVRNQIAVAPLGQLLIP